MNRLITINIDPMANPAIFSRYAYIAEKARQFVVHSFEHETLNDFVTQAANDIKDESVRLPIKTEIRRMQRFGRGGC